MTGKKDKTIFLQVLFQVTMQVIIVFRVLFPCSVLVVSLQGHKKLDFFYNFVINYFSLKLNSKSRLEMFQDGGSRSFKFFGIFFSKTRAAHTPFSFLIVVPSFWKLIDGLFVKQISII